MRVIVKDNVVIKEINTFFIEACDAVFDECSKHNIKAVLTSAADGYHPKEKYHAEGYGWDFRIKDWPLLGVMYQNIRAELKTISLHYHLELELTKGNMHLHVHYAYDEKEQHVDENALSVLDIPL